MTGPLGLDAAEKGIVRRESVYLMFTDGQRS
jgi:hypothetical protein